MKKFKLYVILFFVSCIESLRADPIVDQIAEDFVRQLPIDWNVAQGDWNYFDVVDCFINGPTCYGNNPTSPYGYPSFEVASENSAPMGFKIKPNDAIVIFFRTPPKMRYFGLTQYLYSRATESTTVFASLSDTVNNLNFKIIGQGKADMVYDNYAVLVWTGDMNTYERVKSNLALQGIPESQINFLPLPVNLPLSLGDSSAADNFSMLMRTAMPDVQANFDVYKDEKPFYVLKVGPAIEVLAVPAPTVGYANEISNIVEDPQLKTSLDELVKDIQLNYANSFRFAQESVSFIDKVGWDCILSNKECAGDNHDALYSLDMPKSLKVKTLSDFVLIVGVNHQKTGKATYANHSVYDMATKTGIASVNDLQFTSQSALFHAGIKNPRDPRVSKYKNLYAYAISYRCGTMKFCLPIPAPTAENPVGLEPGAPFAVLGRAYLEPTTGVRPSPSEIVSHQSFVATRLSTSR